MAEDELTPSTDEPQADQPDRDWQTEAAKWEALANKHDKAAKETADARSTNSGARSQERRVHQGKCPDAHGNLCADRGGAAGSVER